MSESHIRNVIEAALLAAGGPIPVADLARLFEERARPSLDEVRAALAGNLCRCGTHGRIIRAVLRAAEEMERN